MKKTTYEELENEIIKVAEMYNSTGLESARDAYEQFVSLIILDRPLCEQGGLEKLWEDSVR